MVDTEARRQHWFAPWTILLCLFNISSALAIPVPLAKVRFSEGPESGNVTWAVPWSDGKSWVVVLPTGVDFTKAILEGEPQSALHWIGHDSVSRVGLVVRDGILPGNRLEWSERSDCGTPQPLLFYTPKGFLRCQSKGKVQKVGAKVLPLALMQVDFGQPVPIPGTPVMNQAEKIVGLVFQSAGGGNLGYVIPVEAVRRVQQDVSEGGAMIRGWIGLSLKAESPDPKIFRVLPDSPAAVAGILPNDVLVGIGTKNIASYPDAADAFFYLAPDEPVVVRLKRNSKTVEYRLTPTRPK